MSRLLGIAVVQRTILEGGAEANLGEVEITLDKIAFQYPWVDLVVMPELTLQGFGGAPVEEQAEAIPGPITYRIGKKAKEIKKWIVAGSMLEKDGERVYNTIPVFSPEGEIVATYRKMNPYSPLEPTTEGTECVVFEIPGLGKIGLANCYDLWFPELSRSLVSMGADVILHPSLTPSTLIGRETLTRSSMAMLNQVYVVGASCCGPCNGLATAGRSIIVDPDGTVMQEAGDAPSIMIDMLDLDRVKAAREVGIKGIAPVYKHINHYKQKWPVYGNQMATSPYISSFGSPYELVDDLNKIEDKEV